MTRQLGGRGSFLLIVTQRGADEIVECRRKLAVMKDGFALPPRIRGALATDCSEWKRGSGEDDDEVRAKEGVKPKDKEMWRKWMVGNDRE